MPGSGTLPALASTVAEVGLAPTVELSVTRTDDPAERSAVCVLSTEFWSPSSAHRGNRASMDSWNVDVGTFRGEMQSSPVACLVTDPAIQLPVTAPTHNNPSSRKYKLIDGAKRGKRIAETGSSSVGGLADAQRMIACANIVSQGRRGNGA